MFLIRRRRSRRALEAAGKANSARSLKLKPSGSFSDPHHATCNTYTLKGSSTAEQIDDAATNAPFVAGGQAAGLKATHDDYKRSTNVARINRNVQFADKFGCFQKAKLGDEVIVLREAEDGYSDLMWVYHVASDTEGLIPTVYLSGAKKGIAKVTSSSSTYISRCDKCPRECLSSRIVSCPYYGHRICAECIYEHFMKDPMAINGLFSQQQENEGIRCIVYSSSAFHGPEYSFQCLSDIPYALIKKVLSDAELDALLKIFHDRANDKSDTNGFPHKGSQSLISYATSTSTMGSTGSNKWISKRGSSPGIPPINRRETLRLSRSALFACMVGIIERMNIETDLEKKLLDAIQIRCANPKCRVHIRFPVDPLHRLTVDECHITCTKCRARNCIISNALTSGRYRCCAPLLPYHEKPLLVYDVLNTCAFRIQEELYTRLTEARESEVSDEIIEEVIFKLKHQLQSVCLWPYLMALPQDMWEKQLMEVARMDIDLAKCTVDRQYRFQEWISRNYPEQSRMAKDQMKQYKVLFRTLHKLKLEEANQEFLVSDTASSSPKGDSVSFRVNATEYDEDADEYTNLGIVAQ